MTKAHPLSQSFRDLAGRLRRCRRTSLNRGAPARPASSVSVVTPAVQQWPAIYEATGTVRARTSAIIAAKWMGYVREVKVQVGDRVREGQLLVVLDARDLDASANQAAAAREEVRNGIPEADSAVAAAKANLDLVQSTFKRMNELYEKKSISDQEFDEASAKLKAAQAGFEMARAKRTQLDAQAGSSRPGSARGPGDAELRRGAGSVRRHRDGEIGGPGKSRGARRAAAHHRARRLSAGSLGGRIQAGCDSRWPAGVGDAGWDRSHA